MRIPRVYQDQPIQKGDLVCLNQQASHHVINVLRLKTGHSLTVFSGDGAEHEGLIETIAHKQAYVRLQQTHYPHAESPLHIHLAQGIAKSDKMDWIIEKSVELGVTAITPVFTDRCQVKLTDDKRAKRLRHWQRIVINACEQSGRVNIPTMHPPINLENWLKDRPEGGKLALLARSSTPLSALTRSLPRDLNLAIGPEGGFSDKEQQLLNHSGFQAVGLGPRVLRTETASIAGLTALQLLLGDMT